MECLSSNDFDISKTSHSHTYIVGCQLITQSKTFTKVKLFDFQLNIQQQMRTIRLSKLFESFTRFFES